MCRQAFSRFDVRLPLAFVAAVATIARGTAVVTDVNSSTTNIQVTLLP